MSSNKQMDSFQFDMPKNQSNVIKVIGVGGGGSNAINHMFSQGINGVDFVICNTDSQALDSSPVPNKIQLGVTLTEGLGAGANPEIGEQSAVESMEDIKAMLTTNTKMLFITAGMGGGTGTGAAPIIAKMAKDLNILTVGIVTIPFEFEGKMRNQQANIGVERLRDNVDSLIVINNNKLRDVYGNLGFKAGFSKADEVLATAARGIAEVITHHYTQNIDLRDAKTVLSNSGTAIMGSASASGTNRASEAISKALDSPLLNDNKIKGATNVLLLIVSGLEEITIDEIGEISDFIQSEAGHGANIIMGVGDDESLEDSIAITVIATGFNVEQQNDIVNTESKKVIHILDDEQRAEQVLVSDKNEFNIGLISNEPITNKMEEPIIRHSLFEEVKEVAIPKKSIPFKDCIETSDLLKNIEVNCEEIDIHHLAEFEEVTINEINVEDFIIVDSKLEETIEDEFTEVNINIESPEEQILMFDLEVNTASEETFETKKQYHKAGIKLETMTSSVEEIEVNDHIEVAPITEVTKEQTITYSLDNYQEVEDHLNEAKPLALEDEISDEEIVFETRIIAVPERINKEENEPEDPLNTPISKLLSERTEIRKRQMKEFNYKFNNKPSHIDEIEKQPAYKRMGIELDKTSNQESNLSRTSVNTDDDNELDLRSNNSFLHDNVD
ncbi:MAG: cell division protein FtsZ [Flavobacteriaceae bacterium]|jgi:cell division protein FtsZ|nr:cell division protein FtsZ [Flavobacteriaceae bacterium]MBT6705403.1 cell division protein FtsZ [Flavobacteriaceae bacterium]|tara:strand:+ start:2658 stop:4670 length:2013 start_codon:yes stop_codon:yes gene_type:complete